jgi:dihydroxyacetone kinase phosphotransfer subunit
MVSLLIVSHSATLAAGVKEFVEQVAGGSIHVGAVGGALDGSLGTSVDYIRQALQQAATPEGILILVDLGSAVMSVQMALEMLDGLRAIISNAPLVEGAYLAASEAAAGSTLEETAAAALQAHTLTKIHDD